MTSLPRSTAPRLVPAARFAVLAALLSWGSPAAGTLDPAVFPVPGSLEPNVEFWTRVYTAYDSHQVLLHDELYLNVVYAVIDFTALDESELPAPRKELRRRQEIEKARSRYRDLLRDLAAGRESIHHRDEQARIEQLFAAVPGGPSKFAAAAHRLRVQTCLKDQFAAGIERSGVYMARIEEIFADRGLPIELTRLPFVESLFQWQARSSAAAGGIWQFVPSTAHLYRLKMELEVDERYEPLRATDAAARHLEDNYRSLESWPLAITAYNHGLAGMRRAVRRLGTRDLGEIATRYRSRYFGFASRNFYSEFVAAVRIYEDRERYFPGVEPRAPLAADELVPDRFVPIRELAKAAGVEIDVLREINPALTPAVWAGHVYLPASYRLRVPAGTGAAFETAYATLPDSRKSAHQVGHYYRVRQGDTLGRIAEKFGTSTSALQRANRLRSVHRIRVGQRLLIPPGGGAGNASVGAQTTTGGVHVVRPGETLTQIAATYGTTVKMIQATNRLRSADRIFVGQRLVVR